MKEPVISERLFRNLQILTIARTVYFTNAGLSPSLLSTSMLFIKESNRIPAAKAVLPLIFNDNNRRIMSKAIDIQGEQEEHWEQPELDKPIWTHLRKLGIPPLKNQQIDDLLQLDYPNLLEGLDVPNAADISLFWKGLVDFLINSWSILEELRLASLLAARIEEEDKQSAQQPRDPRVTRIVGWTHMQFEHHILNAVLRLRAGWDKLADYLIAHYYGIQNISTKKGWPKRVGRLNRELLDQLSPEQKPLWENILENASAIAERRGLRDFRNLELHRIALRSRETLGDKQSAHSLKQLESFAVIEHHRLQDNFLLFLGLILSGPRTNKEVLSGQ